MKKGLKHWTWMALNLYGWIFGWPALRNINHFFLLLNAHALGYDNLHFSGERRFVRQVLAPTDPKVCFDVGANVGEYSKMLLRYTSAQVYAFEPDPTASAMLKKIERLHVVQSAVADFNGNATLHTDTPASGQASLDDSIGGTHAIPVSVTTLAAYAKTIGVSEVDLLKIDVEGYEREVLQGLGDLRPKMIQFEFNIHHIKRGMTVYSLACLMPEYTLYRLLPHGLIRIDPAKFDSNLFIFSNFVAIRR